MKWSMLFLLTALSIWTSYVYSGVVGSSILLLDPVLILVAWFCLQDEWPRIFAVSVMILLYRFSLTIATPLEVVVPPLALIFTIRMLSGGISPFHFWRRFLIVVPALCLSHLISNFILFRVFDLSIERILLDAALAFIVSATMFSVLDVIRPLLKTAKYPD